MKRKTGRIYTVLACVLLFGPIIAGPILMATHHMFAGILTLVIPYGCIALVAFIRKNKRIREYYKIKDAHTRVRIIPIEDSKTLRALYDNSALTFQGEPSDHYLDGMYNWLNNEGVLKEEGLNLYVFDGSLIKDTFGKRKRFENEEKFMSIFLKDLDLNESNMRRFSTERMKYGGRWLDDVIGSVNE